MGFEHSPSRTTLKMVATFLVFVQFAIWGILAWFRCLGVLVRILSTASPIVVELCMIYMRPYRQALQLLWIITIEEGADCH